MLDYNYYDIIRNNKVKKQSKYFYYIQNIFFQGKLRILFQIEG